MWQRLQRYLNKGLALLDAAQVESLGGARGALVMPRQAVVDGAAWFDDCAETSPDYPGNWTRPFSQLSLPCHRWACRDWELKAIAQTTIGGERRCNQELLGVKPSLRAGMMLSTLTAPTSLSRPGPNEALDWRQPSLALRAGLQGLVGHVPDSLPCHVRQREVHQCQATQRMQRALRECNRALLRWATMQPGRHALSAGALLHVCCGTAWFVQLGGLHLYRWRDGSLLRLSPQTNESDEPRPLPHPTQRTLVSSRGHRYLGFRELPALPVLGVPIQEGDIFLVASRGLYETVSERALEQAITEHPGTIEAGCSRLSDIAWSSRDQVSDISLILLEVAKDLRGQRNQAAKEWHGRLERCLF